MNYLGANMKLIAESSQQLVRLGENLWGKGTTEENVSFDTESEWLKHEITLPEGYIFKDENGNVINATKIVLEKKKKEYPKTYEECYCVLLERASVRTMFGYKADLMVALQKLLVCRDAYWKIAGDEMGLGKPWSPNDSPYVYCIYAYKGEIFCDTPSIDCVLMFPTAEMRDAFYENFKELIEQCKELL